MTIQKNMNGKTLEIGLEGRLDTTTAPQLEEVITKEAPQAESIVFDLTQLVYISSAGLRVLLMAHKLMSDKEGMKVTHVNGLVQEVFDVTGFSDLLVIE